MLTFIKVEDQHMFWRKLGPPPFSTSLLSDQKDFPWSPGGAKSFSFRSEWAWDLTLPPSLPEV